MIILAKCALALTSTIVVAGVYTFREGVIKIDVDEHRDGGSHVHFWVPAAAVPMAMHFVPKRHFREMPAEASECLPLLRIVTSATRTRPSSTYKMAATTFESPPWVQRSRSMSLMTKKTYTSPSHSPPSTTSPTN